MSMFSRLRVEKALELWVCLQFMVLLKLIGDPLKEIVFFTTIWKSKGNSKILEVLLSPCLVQQSSEYA